MFNLLISSPLFLFRQIFSRFSNFTQINQPSSFWSFMLFCLSFLSFFATFFIWFSFDRFSFKYQGIIDLKPSFLEHKKIYFNLLFGLDGISVCFILLTMFIAFLTVCSLQRSSFLRLNTAVLYYIVIFFGLLCAFTTLDLLLFFIFFESLLIPMYLLIGNWGSRYRKIKANFYFFLYTLLGSIFLLFLIVSIYFELGTTLFCLLPHITVEYSKEQLFWVCVFVAFSVKTPTFPFHLWLPEAHVEAPTAGSVILAALLLKLGGYGFLRLLLPSFYASNFFFSPYIKTLCILSIVHASLTSARQVDLKRIVAYSSIAHMNFGILGLFSLNLVGIQGSLFLMLAHGIVSAALFFCIGVLYERHHSRNLFYYGGLVQTMPLFSFYFLLFSFANIGLPGTCNFIGELLIILGLVSNNFFVLVFASSGVVFSVMYTITMLNKVIFGNVKVSYFTRWKDITKKENFILMTLGITTLFFGVAPNFLLELSFPSISYLLFSIFYW